MSKSLNNPSDQWLIKSANRVMGPFKYNEVVTGLHLKHFTVMDEISIPFGRWILIRDEQALQSAVKDVRNRADANENTHTLTQTMTSSLSVPEFMSGVDAPPPIPGEFNPRLLKDPKILAQIQKRSVNFLIGLILSVVCVSIGVYFYLGKKKIKDASQEGLAQALQLKEQGFYEKSFALLAKLKSGDKENSQIDLELAIFQIVLQNQNNSGRKSIEKILNQLDSKENIAVAHTAIALSYINENDFKSASDAINRALTLNATLVPALLNKAIIDFKNGNPDIAEKDFEPILNQANNGVVVLASTLASLEVSRRGLMPKRIFPVLIQVIDDYLKSNFEYQQECYVVKAYIYNILNKPQQRQEAVLQLLNSDLESGQGHRYDLLADRSILNWKNLLPYCQTSIEADPNDFYNRSLLAYCLSKAGNDEEAKKIILEAEAEAPRHPYVAAIKAYIMRTLGLDSESRASLAIAMGQKEILSAWLLKSKYCELDHKDECMQDSLNKLMEISPRSLPAYVSLARMENRRGNKRGAQDWIARGQSLSQSYIPLWEIKNSL